MPHEAPIMCCQIFLDKLQSKASLIIHSNAFRANDDGNNDKSSSNVYYRLYKKNMM